MQRKTCIPLRRTKSPAWLASIENYRSRGTGMQHPCKFELPKCLMTALANTVISLGKPDIAKSGLSRGTDQALSFDGEVPSEPHADSEDLLSWGAILQEVVQPLRRCKGWQAFSGEKCTFWKWDLESGSPTYMFTIEPEFTQVKDSFLLLCTAYFWKASRPSQPVINKVFAQLKLMATCWQITFINFYIFVFLSDTDKVR